MRSICFMIAFLACATGAAFLARGLFSSSDSSNEDNLDPSVFRSGPQAGAKVPGPFEPLNINGPKAGKEDCLYCRYGKSPVAMFFARKPSEGTIAFIRELEKAALATGKSDAALGACVIVTDTSPETRSTLSKLAESAKLKYVVLGTIDPQELKHYRLNSDAEATMVLYRNHLVQANHAYRAGEFTPKAAAELGSETETFLATN